MTLLVSGIIVAGTLFAASRLMDRPALPPSLTAQLVAAERDVQARVAAIRAEGEAEAKRMTVERERVWRAELVEFRDRCIAKGRAIERNAQAQAAQAGTEVTA